MGGAAEAPQGGSQPGLGTLTPIGGGAGGGGNTPSGLSPSGGSLADGGNVNGLVPTSALPRPPPPPDDFELDAAEVVCHERVAAGAFGDLYRGTYCGTDVAVKILRNVATDTAQFAEFLQEVHIMRKVRHRNVVQFIGACTQRPNLCIVFEYLPGEFWWGEREGEEGGTEGGGELWWWGGGGGLERENVEDDKRATKNSSLVQKTKPDFFAGGSVFDWMRARGPPALLALLKMGAEVARGMDYLHKRRVVHRDLKAANLLLDDAGCVKIADFGVARLLDAGGGVMTAETGTYRWMAPEIITHAPYDEKADVYSYGILLWELLTGEFFPPTLFFSLLGFFRGREGRERLHRHRMKNSWLALLSPLLSTRQGASPTPISPPCRPRWASSRRACGRRSPLAARRGWPR